MIATKQFETVEEVRESIGKSNNIIRFKKTRNFSEVQKDIEKFKEVTQYEYRT
ncbi:Uncharacterised protein [Staphylococcus gallinarum]|nr:Uncharacterised protein [Staphylococcus gallinarum]